MNLNPYSLNIERSKAKHGGLTDLRRWRSEFRTITMAGILGQGTAEGGMVQGGGWGQKPVWRLLTNS